MAVVSVSLSITIMCLEKGNEQCGCRIIATEETFPFPLGQKDFYLADTFDQCRSRFEW